MALRGDLNSYLLFESFFPSSSPYQIHSFVFMIATFKIAVFFIFEYSYVEFPSAQPQPLKVKLNDTYLCNKTFMVLYPLPLLLVL